MLASRKQQGELHIKTHYYYERGGALEIITILTTTQQKNDYSMATTSKKTSDTFDHTSCGGGARGGVCVWFRGSGTNRLPDWYQSTRSLLGDTMVIRTRVLSKGDDEADVSSLSTLSRSV